MTKILLLFAAIGSLLIQIDARAEEGGKSVTVYPGALCSGAGDISHLELLQTRPPSKVGFDFRSMVAVRTREPSPRMFRMTALGKDKQTKEATAMFEDVSTQKIMGITFISNTKKSLKGSAIFGITLIAGSISKRGETDQKSMERGVLLCPARMTDLPEELDF